MRLVSAVLFVALTGSAAFADDTKPADPKPDAVATVAKKKVPYRVVKMLPETGQVLLYDKHHGTHVVAEVGQTLDGYTVDDIDEDEVTLIADNGASIILTSPPPAHVPKRKAKPAPVDPYADPSAPAEGVTADASAPAEADADADAAAEHVAAETSPGSRAVDASGRPRPVAAAKAGGPVDPYADPEPPVSAGEGGVRVASASSAPAPRAPAAPIVEAGPPAMASDPYGDPGIAAFATAVGAGPDTTAAPATAPAPAKAARKTGKAKGKAKAAAAPAPDAASALAAAATGDETAATHAAAPRPVPAGGRVIARAELDAALADFGKTANTFRATFTADGLRLDSIADGSLLAKAGLRKGDVVTYVDGRPLRTLDDAAGLYARAGSLRDTTIQVARDGKLVTLVVAFQ